MSPGHLLQQSENYYIQAITDAREFSALAQDWSAVADCYRGYHPFLCHDWYGTWLEHFLDHHGRLFILILREIRTDRPLAIFPLLETKARFKQIRATQLELIGNMYSPARFFLVNRNLVSDGQALAAVLNFLRSRRSEWDLLALDALPEELIHFDSIESTSRLLGLKYHRSFAFGNWYLDDIHYNGDHYIATRSSNIRNNATRYRRKLKALGHTRISIVKDTADVDRAMDHYYHVYFRSWKRTETDPTFHRDLAISAAKKGWLRLGLLFVDERPIASQLWLVCNNHAYIAKLAYDEEYKKFIPGVILSLELMKYVIDGDKVQEVDYLIGDEPYKKDWTPKRRERSTFHIFSPTPKGKALYALMHHVLPFVRRHRALGRMKEELSRLRAPRGSAPQSPPSGSASPGEP